MSSLVEVMVIKRHHSVVVSGVIYYLPPRRSLRRSIDCINNVQRVCVGGGDRTI